jgi:molybdopterin synthase catalytic subunit
MIAVSSPHRRESIAACEYAIDELKRDVPIWKKVVITFVHGCIHSESGDICRLRLTVEDKCGSTR